MGSSGPAYTSHSSLVRQRNAACSKVFEDLDFKYSRGAMHGQEMDAAALHRWKLADAQFETNLSQLRQILQWLKDVRDGKATEEDKPIFAEDLSDLLSGNRPTSAPGKSRLVGDSKPTVHQRDQFWSNKATERIANKLNFYRNVDNHWQLGKRIKEYQQAELAAIAETYGDEAPQLTSKVQLNKKAAFKLTKKYWKKRRMNFKEQRRRMTSTAKVIRAEQIKRKLAAKQKTVMKRKRLKKARRLAARRRKRQKKWISITSVVNSSLVLRNLHRHIKKVKFQREQEENAQIVISRAWRLHSNTGQERRVFHAAVFIQKIARGYRARFTLHKKNVAADFLSNYFHKFGKLAKLRRCIAMRHRAATCIKRAWKDRTVVLKKQLRAGEERLEEIAEQTGATADQIAPEIREEILNEVLRKKRVIWKDTIMAKYSFDYRTYNQKLQRLKAQASEDPTAKVLIRMIRAPRRPTFDVSVPDKEMRDAYSTCLQFQHNPRRWRAKKDEIKQWLVYQDQKHL
jgi:hypothetical protein